MLPRVTTEETETSEARQQPAQAVFHPPLRNQLAIALLGDVDGVLLAQFGLETGHDEAVGFIDLRLEPVRAIASEVRLSEALADNPLRAGIAGLCEELGAATDHIAD